MHARPGTLGKVADICIQVDAESEKMLKIAMRVRSRLQHHLTRTADERTLPNEDFRESWRFYVNTVVALQRYAAARPEQLADKPSMAPADYEAELEIIARECLEKKTASERRDFLQSVEQELTEKQLTDGKKSTASVLTPAPDRWNS